MVGVMVFGLFVIWLTNRVSSKQVATPVILDQFGGRKDGVLGESLKLDAPDPGELAQETDLVEPELENMMTLVEDVVAARIAQLDDPLLAEEFSSGKSGRSDGTGDRAALGEDGDLGGIPREKRWVVRFEQSTLTLYAQQLDFFGIELAAVGGGRVEYVGNLSNAQPTKRVARTGAREKRMYLTWREGALRQFDLKLLARAKVNTKDKSILQFLPSRVEQNLALLEQQFAGRKPEEIRRTTFGIRNNQGEFSFHVLDQDAL